MIRMEANTKKQFSVYDVSYPCYIAGIPEGERIIHIPGRYEYKDLEETYGYVIEGYKTKDKIYLFDCLDVDLWYKSRCDIRYEKRIRMTRAIISESISKRKVVQDLPMVLCDTPIDAIDYLDNLMGQGFEKARIMYSKAYYVFGECQNDEYVEIEL